MADDKKSFLVYDNWARIFANIPEEQAGEIIKAMCCKKLGMDYEISDPMAAGIFASIAPQMDEDEEKYQEVCQRRSENGRKGGRGKKAKESNSFSEKAKESNSFSEKANGKLNEAKKADNDTDTDNDNDNENDTDTEYPSGTRGDARTRVDTPAQKTELEQCDLDDLSEFFDDKELAESVSTWLKYRDQMGRFPAMSIRRTIEKAQQAEKEYGADKCVELIDDCIASGYKSITWDRLERGQPRARSGTNSNDGDDYFMRLAKGEIA